jgi:hypothetical protein
MPPQDINEAVRVFQRLCTVQFMKYLFGSKLRLNRSHGPGMMPERKSSWIIFTDFVYIRSSNPSLTFRITSNIHLVRSSPISIQILRLKLISDSNLILTREKTNLHLSLCELLSTFALQHSFRSHFFMLTSAISSHVATLLSSKDKHLRLGQWPSIVYLQEILIHPHR